MYTNDVMTPKESPMSVSISLHPPVRICHLFHFSLFFPLPSVTLHRQLNQASTEINRFDSRCLAIGPSPSTGRHYRSRSRRHRSSPPHRNRHIPLLMAHARVSLLGIRNWRNSAGSPESGMIAEWMPHEYGEWRTRNRPRVDYFHKRCAG